MFRVVVSDVHGFYSIMKKALDKVGYDKENPNHFFVSCGDLFERGDQANECLEFVTSLPKERRAFVEGNHEKLLMDILFSGIYHRSDIHNGTVDTIFQLSHIKSIYDLNEGLNILSRNEKLYEYLSSLVNYHEINDYAFVHGWLPRVNGLYTKNWRSASVDEFRQATWTNGFHAWYLNQTEASNIENKTVVCGHWHTAYAHSRYHHEGKDVSECNGDYTQCCFDIFRDKGIIGLDACTVLSQRVNVLVIEERTGES